MTDRTDAVLASIDGALADALLPDGMRWHPDPAQAPTPGPGLVRIVPPPGQPTGDQLRAFWESLHDVLRPLAEEVAGMMLRLGEALAAAPLPGPRIPGPAEEDRRTAALRARRQRNTGPALLGPERSHPPRRIR